jgi:hypothetical protein
MNNDAMNDDARLQEIARKLGTRAADRLDVEAITRNVLERLRETPQPGRRPVWQRPAFLRIAATLVVLVGGAVALKQIRPMKDYTNHAAHFVSDDLSDLSTAQLQDVLRQFDELVGSATVTDSGPDLRELDAQQLRQVLRSLEG